MILFKFYVLAFTGFWPYKYVFGSLISLLVFLLFFLFTFCQCSLHVYVEYRQVIQHLGFVIWYCNNYDDNLYYELLIVLCISRQFILIVNAKEIIKKKNN